MMDANAVPADTLHLAIQRQAGFASSGQFASPEPQPSAMQFDAVQCDLFHDDASDGRDANLGASMAAPGPNGDGWEEGEL